MQHTTLCVGSFGAGADFLEAAMQATTEQMEKMTTNLVQAATDMNTLMRDTVAATLQSVEIITKGYGELYESLSSLMQKTIDQSAKISQTLMTTSSVNDLVDTQNTVMKSNFDSLMSDLNNITQLSSRIAQQAAEPVTKHVNASLTKMSKVRAA